MAPPQDCREEMTKACTSIGADMALGADISYVIDLLYNVCPPPPPPAPCDCVLYCGPSCTFCTTSHGPLPLLLGVPASVCCEVWCVLYFPARSCCWRFPLCVVQFGAVPSVLYLCTSCTFAKHYLPSHEKCCVSNAGVNGHEAPRAGTPVASGLARLPRCTCGFLCAPLPSLSVLSTGAPSVRVLFTVPPSL